MTGDTGREGADGVRAVGADSLLDAYFDRTICAAGKTRLARLVAADPDAGAAFSELDRAVEGLRTPVRAPDFSAAILGEVGRRRGWLGAGVQRLVSVGRLAVAAVLLLGLGVGLAVKRWSPDSVVFSPPATPIAAVTECAATDADCNVAGLRRAFGFDDHGASDRERVRFSGAGVMSARVLDVSSMRAALVAPPGLAPIRADSEGVRFVERSAGADFVMVRFVTSCDGSARPLNVTERVGAVAVASKPATARRTAAESDKEPAVGGW